MKFQRAIYSTLYVSLLFAIFSLDIAPDIAHAKDGYYVGVNIGGAGQGQLDWQWNKWYLGSRDAGQWFSL